MLEKNEQQRLYRINESPLHCEIRDAMREVTERAARRNVPLFLTGGISAALLSRDSWPGEERPLSRDLDFLVPGDKESRAALEQEFGGSFIVNKKKAIFQSDKLMAHASNGVQLDFIACSNIVHPDAELSVRLDALPSVRGETEDFLGAEVSTLPPEVVIIQKLFAGRGIDLGKFDLKDAESIIRSGRVDVRNFAIFVSNLTQEGVHRNAVNARLRAALLALDPSTDIQPLLKTLENKDVDGIVQQTRDVILTPFDLGLL